MKWEDVWRPRKFGGLGIGHFKEINSAILGKWLWRFSCEEGNVWQSIIWHKYGVEPNGWDCLGCVSPSISLLWKRVIFLFPLFLPRIRFIIGDGNFFFLE